jgi:hypothetical protein
MIPCWAEAILGTDHRKVWWEPTPCVDSTGSTTTVLSFPFRDRFRCCFRGCFRGCCRGYLTEMSSGLSNICTALYRGCFISLTFTENVLEAASEDSSKPASQIVSEASYISPRCPVASPIGPQFFRGCVISLTFKKD